MSQIVTTDAAFACFDQSLSWIKPFIEGMSDEDFVVSMLGHPLKPQIISTVGSEDLWEASIAAQKNALYSWLAILFGQCLQSFAPPQGPKKPCKNYQLPPVEPGGADFGKRKRNGTRTSNRKSPQRSSNSVCACSAVGDPPRKPSGSRSRLA